MFLRKIIIFIFILIVFSYVVYTARGVLFSPSLDIFSPKDWEHVSGTRVNFSGRTIPKNQVWVDGRLLESDDSGFFESIMIFHPGYNEMGISVKNRFGKETKKILKFVVE